MANVKFEYDGQVSSGGFKSWDNNSRKRVTVELDDDENKDSVYAFCYDLDALTNHDINEINAMNGIQ